MKNLFVLIIINKISDDIMKKLFSNNIKHILYTQNRTLKKSFLRNKEQVEYINTLIYNDFIIHLFSEKVFFQKEEIHLTGKSFQLLLFFINNNNKIIKKKDIFEAIWKDKSNTNCINVLEVLIGTLQKELNKIFKQSPLIYKQKKGYIFKYGSKDIILLNTNEEL